MIDTVAETPVTPEHILQTGLAFWASKTLLSAVELELFTKLAGQPATAEICAHASGFTSEPRSISSTPWLRSGF